MALLVLIRLSLGLFISKINILIFVFFDGRGGDVIFGLKALLCICYSIIFLGFLISDCTCVLPYVLSCLAVERILCAKPVILSLSLVESLPTPSIPPN
jgi:hypothetical protein